MTVVILKKQTVDGVELVEGDPVHLDLKVVNQVDVKEGYGK